MVIDHVFGKTGNFVLKIGPVLAESVIGYVLCSGVTHHGQMGILSKSALLRLVFPAMISFRLNF